MNTETRPILPPETALARASAGAQQQQQQQQRPPTLLFDLCQPARALLVSAGACVVSSSQARAWP